MSVLLDARADRAAAVQSAISALRDGDLVVLPTDTLYGVAADAFNPTATMRVFRAKHRSTSLPLPVLIRSQKQLLGLVTRVPEAAERLMAAYWPGPLTIVVPHDPNLQWDLGRANGAVAVRMPFDDITLEIIRAVGPLAVTSANLSGSRPAATASSAQGQLGDAVRVYVDDGARSGLAASTIIDCTREDVHVLREGPIPGQEALEVARGERGPMDVTVVDAPAAREEQPAPSEPTAADRDRLLEIPGLGPAKADALLERFGSVDALVSVDEAALADVRGVGPALAAKVRKHLR